MKKINLSVMAVLLGTALAFAGSKSVTLPDAQASQWFRLAVGADASNPNNYTLVSGVPQECGEPEERCAIFAPEDMHNLGKPTQAGVNNPIEEALRGASL